MLEMIECSTALWLRSIQLINSDKLAVLIT